jgi:hypothetical protein
MAGESAAGTRSDDLFPICSERRFDSNPRVVCGTIPSCNVSAQWPGGSGSGVWPLPSVRSRSPPRAARRQARRPVSTGPAGDDVMEVAGVKGSMDLDARRNTGLKGAAYGASDSSSVAFPIRRGRPPPFARCTTRASSAAERGRGAGLDRREESPSSVQRHRNHSGAALLRRRPLAASPPGSTSVISRSEALLVGG